MANDVQSDVVIKYQSVGADQVNEDLKKTQTGLEGVSVSATGTERATASVENRFRSLERQLSTTSGNQEKFQKIQDAVNRAVAQNPELLERGMAVLAQAESRYGTVSQTLEKYRNELEKIASVQKTINASTGVSGLSDSAARGADIAAYGKQLDDLRAKYNPLFAAGQQYKSTLAEINQAAKVGALTEAEAAAAIAKTKEAFVGQVTAIRQSAAATTVLADAHKGLDAQGQAALHSIRSMVEMLAMGISPVQALTAEMSRLSFVASGEGGIAGAFKQAGSVIAGMVTPMRLAAGGIAGLGAAAVLAGSEWAKAQQQIEQALIGIGAKSGTAIKDVNEFAQRNATATGLSISQTREMGIAFAKTGNIVVSTMDDVGEAVHGYSILTGKTATEATQDFAQALSGDLVKGAQQLNATYGFLNPTIEENIRVLQRQGDRAGATSVILKAIASDNQRAADSVGALGKAWDFVANKASAAAAAIGKAVAAGPSAEEPGLILPPGAQQQEAAKRQAQQMRDAALAAADAWVKMQNATANAADAAIKSTIPELQQLDTIKDRLAEIERQRRAASGVGPLGPMPATTFDDQGATLKLQNQKQLIEQSIEAGKRYEGQVAQVAAKWGNVGQAVAMQLEHMQNNLPVAEAVGGAAKMAAQYTADYKNYMLEGKTATEATALAAANLAQAQAQVESAAKETLWQLQNQAQVAAAVTGAEQMTAQAEATKNQLMHDGVSAMTAQAVAAQQLANAEAAATANVQRQTYSLEQNTRMIYAQMNGTEATEAASQAYDNAMRSGASSAAAAALSAATLANYTAKAAASAAQMAQSYLAIGNAAVMFGSNVFGQYQGANSFAGSTIGTVMTDKGLYLDPTGQLKAYQSQEKANQAAYASQSIGDYIDTIIRGGGIRAGLSAAMSQTGKDMYGGGGRFAESDIESEVQSLYSTLNQGASQATQISNTQAELQWLQSRPASAAQAKAIADLKNSLDQLTKSTNDLNATNQDLLSPYYTQDPRTSHIGFRSQGMAQGGYVDVPGATSANDNMIATVPVSSGERIYVDPMYSRRGLSAGANFNISISSPVLFAGNPNKDEVGRTMYQNNQNLVKQLRSAMQ